MTEGGYRGRARFFIASIRMESDSQHEFRHWVGSLARRAAAFLCIARMHELQAQRAERNLRRAAVTSSGAALSAPADPVLPPPRSPSRRQGWR